MSDEHQGTDYIRGLLDGIGKKIDQQFERLEKSVDRMQEVVGKLDDRLRDVERYYVTLTVLPETVAKQGKKLENLDRDMAIGKGYLRGAAATWGLVGGIVILVIEFVGKVVLATLRH